ncbi:hypothetical protein BJ878DRAFT_311627 [Calycina marina]|uniref:Uncharacterized protein n=1 Tax=Calycina marina TaxID=1763456 RepID=A0A9P8CB54_9HELO|nr:hypothetical protein BJ878DRAFT_311627 [Calycina marina]
MCFYDQIKQTCNCYKWSHFRQHCSKEYRTGETCGMKLVMQTVKGEEKCRICTKIDTKKRAIRREQDKIKRWKREPNRSASIEKAESEILRHEVDLYHLEEDRLRKQGML